MVVHAKPSEEPSLTVSLRAPLLADRLTERLRNDILGENLKSGEKLPTEREIAQRYGVSRAIVREALGRLKQDGLVVTRQGSGAFVGSKSAHSFRLDGIEGASPQEVTSVIELLSAIRSAASAHAATRRTNAELQAIKRAFRQMQTAIDKGMPGIDEDIAFHRAIIDATKNSVFRDLLDFLDSRVRVFIRAARLNSKNAGLTQQVQQEHALILKAIINKDPEAARRAAADHLQNALGRLQKYGRGWK